MKKGVYFDEPKLDRYYRRALAALRKAKREGTEPYKGMTTKQILAKIREH